LKCIRIGDAPSFLEIKEEKNLDMEKSQDPFKINEEAGSKFK
jgi:hypothetical protein